MEVNDRGPGREAKTIIHDVKILKDDRYDLTIEIITGVRHQIRCQLAHVGWPIIGDPLYGAGTPPLHLHSWRLTVEGRQTIEAPVPAYWPNN